MTIASLDHAATLLGAGLLAGLALAPTKAAMREQDPAEPCCSITAIDASRRQVTLQHNQGSTTFEVLLAAGAQLRQLQVGQRVSLSGVSRTLVVPRGVSPLLLRAATIRAIPREPAPGGAVASAASAPSGDFRRSPATKGRCPSIKETPTEQCVLTHDLSGSGQGCEYYCVPRK